MSTEWTKVVDIASGASYFWNSSSGAVSWTAPAEMALQPSVPSPWVSVADAKCGQSYWWNQATGERSWTAPPTAPAAPVVAAPAGLPAPPGATAPTIKPAVPGADAAAEPAAGAAAPTTVPAASPHICAAATRTSAGESAPQAAAPAEPAAGDTAPTTVPAAAPVVAEPPAASPVIAAAPLPSLLMQRLAQRGVAVPGAASAPSAPAVAPPTAPLPPGWRTDRDPGGRVFYIHASSGQTSWTLPSSAPLHAAAPTEGTYALSLPSSMPMQRPTAAGGYAPPAPFGASAADAAPALSSKDIIAMAEARDLAKKKKVCRWMV